ncbi:5' nucleotidase, NT5C type [Pseudomonas aeruginosa]
MSTEAIAVDLDDVVFDFSGCLYQTALEEGLNPPPIETWNTYDLTGVLGTSYQGFLDFVIAKKILHTVKPIKGAREALNQLRASGKTLVGVTSRGYHPDGYDVTMASLREHHIPLHDLIVVPKGQTKPQAVAESYPEGFLYMVDDYDANLDDMRKAEMVSNTIMICRPWNKHRTEYRQGVSRFGSLKEWVSALQKEAFREVPRFPERALALAY